MNIAIGNEQGKVRVFDIRYPLPIFDVKHHRKQAITKIKFHEKSRTMWTTDGDQIKVYEKNTGKHYTSIMPKSKVNDFEICHDSGLILVA